jgi:hypothetical protein
VTNIDTWFAELDRFADVPFMEDGRRQPVLGTACFGFRVFADTAPGDSRGRSLHKRYGGQ